MTETPKYTVLKKDNAFELRQYLGYIKAEVEVGDSSYRQAIFKGFSILANYIFGDNQKVEKMAMTSPVQVSQSEKIAMTSPVTIRGDGAYKVAFIMPAMYTIDTLPLPKDQQIRIINVPEHLIAAVRFTGFYSKSKMNKAMRKLDQWIEKEGLVKDGEFVTAGYNPPWVPAFLARSEVMARVKPIEN